MRHLYLLWAVTALVQLGGAYFAVVNRLWLSACLLPVAAFLCWCMAMAEARNR
jgi:hypothetical protein